MRKVLLLIVAGALVGVSSARGDEIFLDPATLHIGPGAGTPCATGCAGDPNLVGTSQIDIYQNTAGAPALSSPLLLILGVPNDPTNLFGSTVPINGVTWYNPYSGYPGDGVGGSAAFASAGTYGLKTPVSNGFFGDFDSSSKGDVYSFLNLPADTNSNNWTNWSGSVASKNNITASNFGVYVFALTGSQLDANGLVDVTFLNALPDGTMFVGFGENSTTTETCKTKNHVTTCTSTTTTTVYDTPFTEAGDGHTVPEPGSLMLVGTGLLSMAGAVRRRLKKSS